MTNPWPIGSTAGIHADTESRAYPSLSSLLAECSARHGQAAAYRFLGKSFSFETIDHGAKALAAWFQRQGLKRGDRVAVMLPNLPQVGVALAAIWRLGCVAVPVNPRLSGDDLVFQLKDAGAMALVLLEQGAAAVEAVLGQLPQLSTSRIVIASLGDMLGPIKGGWVNYLERSRRLETRAFHLPKATRFNEALSQGQPLPLTAAPPRPDDLALLMYGSSKRGMRKAAALLHRNLVSGVLQAGRRFGPALVKTSPQTQTVAVCALPWHTPGGFQLSMLLSPFLGVCSLLVSHPDDAGALSKELVGEQVHWLLADEQFLDAPQGADTSNPVDWGALRLCLNLGAPLRPETSRMWKARSACGVQQAYVLSETASLVACSPLEPQADTDSLWPLDACEVSILDAEGQHLPAGVLGEVAVRGPQVMAGYWHRPDLTARTMTAHGFLRTGDRGELDSAGGLTVFDSGLQASHEDEGLLLRRGIDTSPEAPSTPSPWGRRQRSGRAGSTAVAWWRRIHADRMSPGNVDS